MPEIDVVAVLVAAFSSFLLGGLWYSPVLFGSTWNREARQAPQAGHPLMVFALAFLLSLLSAFVFAGFVGPRPPLATALRAGVGAGFGFVATSFGINYLFAGTRSFTMWSIDAGYHTVQFALFGVVLGLWR
jgi:hypothetical protein